MRGNFRIAAAEDVEKRVVEGHRMATERVRKGRKGWGYFKSEKLFMHEG